MQTTDDQDLGTVPEKTAAATRAMVRNAVHLARTIEDQRFPSLR